MKILSVKTFALTLIALLLSSATAVAQPKPSTYQFADIEGKKLYLDHYAASNVEGMRPCVIFAFGGGFVRGDRAHKDYLPYFEWLTSLGIDVVSIDYRLVLKEAKSDSGIRELVTLMYRAVNSAVEDMFAATRFVLDHSVEWNIDTTKIIACGSSAGAITALQAANYISNNDKRAAIVEGFDYAGVISFAGAIFSVSGKPKWGKKPAPIMMFHGNSDSNVPYRKASMFGVGFYGSELITDQLQKLGASYYFYSAKYRTHEMAEVPMYKNRNEIRSFIEHYVLGKSPMQTVVYVDNTAVEKRPTRFKVKEYLSSNYSE